MNPTSTGYEFEWTDESSSHNNPFKCLTMKGFVAGGKKTEVNHTRSDELVLQSRVLYPTIHSSRDQTLIQ